MIKGPRKSAKLILVQYIKTALQKFENPEPIPNVILAELRSQLHAYANISRDMGWTELQEKIERALKVPPAKPPLYPPLTQEQIDAHLYAQANECSPSDYKPTPTKGE